MLPSSMHAGPRPDTVAQPDTARLLANGANPFAAEALHVREMFGILRRRYAAVLLVIIVMVAGATVWLWGRPRLYKASAAVLIVDARRSLAGPILNEPTGRGVGRLTDPIRSHVEVLQGRTVLGKAVDREGLRLVPASDFPRQLLADIVVADDAEAAALALRFTPERVSVRTQQGEVSAVYGEPVRISGVSFTVTTAPPSSTATLHIVPRDYAIDRLAEQLRVLPRPGTDVIEVSYTAADPAHARRVVNATVEVFQVHNLEMVQQQTRLRRSFLEEQLRSTESQLIAAQRALNEFRQARQVYRSSEQLSAQQQALMSLDIQRAEVAADRDMYGSLLNSLRSSPVEARSNAIRTLVSAEGIAGNPGVIGLYSQLSAYQAARDSLTTGPQASTSAHPDVERLGALIAMTETKLIEAAGSHIASLEARLAALDALRLRSVAELQSLPSAETEEARLLQDIQTTSSLAEAIRADMQRSRMAQAIETGQVEILHLAPPARPVYAGRVKRLALAMILGLIFGCGAAFALEMMDGTIRRRSEVEGSLHVACVAVIPPMSLHEGTHARFGFHRRFASGRRRGDGRESPPLINSGDGAAAGAEAFRRLRNHLLSSPAHGPASTFMVTSASAGEGKTVTSANLALMVARRGKRVVLADGDFQQPMVHTLFGVALQPGMSDVLLGRASLAQAVRPTAVEHLYVLAAGDSAEPARDPLEPEALTALLAELSASFEMVILDTPPILEFADAVTFATLSDGVLLVLKAGSTRPDAAHEAVEELGRAGAHLVGAVLTDPEHKVLEDRRSADAFDWQPV